MARNKFDVDESLETPFSFEHFKRAYVYIKPFKGKMILAFFMSALSAVFILFLPMFLETALNEAVPNRDVGQLVMLSLLAAGCTILSIMLATMRSRTMAKVSQEIIYNLRNDVFVHLQRLPFEYYDTRPHGKILIRVINYVNSVSDMLSNGIINFILELFNLVVISVFMLTRSVTLSLVVFAGVPLLLVAVVFLKPAQRRAWQKVSNKSSNLNAYLAESIDGAKLTQVFARENFNSGIFERLNRGFCDSWIKAQYTANLVWYIVENISVLIVSALYIVGFYFIGTGLQIGTLIAVAGYAWRFWQPILSISNIYNGFINAIAYLERIFELLDEPVSVTDSPDAKPLPDISGEVTFEDVTFSYDGSINILENFNLDVSAGESIALVGPTGAGKTTVVNLISRFYNINAGRLLIDGYDASKSTLNSLRSQMGIMLQDSFIFSDTIMENVRYGKLDATDEDVIAACKAVYAHDFITEFELGYDTPLSERGSRLSQGQKQLIAFARTLLSNPKILVLDEATSAIDAKTEILLQQGIQTLLKSRTSFIIAHRLSTIKHCDRILYISDRGIKEQGTHDDLLALKGEYYKLYMTQHDDIID